MSIVTQLGQRAEAVETRFAAEEFCKLARLLAATRGDKAEALQLAHAHRTKPRVVEILKSVVSPAGLGDWGAIADYAVITAAFSESLRALSAFDGMLPSFVPAPLRSRGIVVQTGITGSNPAERAIKPISTISLGTALVEPRKSTAVIIVTEEVTKSADSNISGLFDRELKAAVAAATDAAFLSALVAATTPTASTGNTYANVMSDFKTLFSAVTTHAASKLFYIVSPANAKNLMFINSNQGVPVFPALQSAAQSFLSVTAIASDQIPAGTALLVDATGIAGSADTIVLDSSNQTSLQLESAPDSPPTGATSVLSLFQSDLRALRAERFYGFTVIRPTALASLSGVAY